MDFILFGEAAVLKFLGEQMLTNLIRTQQV